MKLAQVIEKLRTIVAQKPPFEAILSAKENWQEFLPVIIGLMDKFHTEVLTEEENKLLFFGILLLVEMKQEDQFERFVALCDGDDEYASPLGCLLGDSVTDGLSSYFYILANGRHKPLEKLLLSKFCGEYIRNAALDAIFAQYESGQLPKETLSALVDRLLILYKEHEEFYLIGSLSDLLINYQWKTYQPEVIKLCEENFIESFSLSKKNIETWHATGKNEGVLASGLVKKEFDVAKHVSLWCCYQKAPVKSLSNKKNRGGSLYEKKVVPSRNEPCHCGSGKKYKKCCI